MPRLPGLLLLLLPALAAATPQAAMATFEAVEVPRCVESDEVAAGVRELSTKEKVAALKAKHAGRTPAEGPRPVPEKPPLKGKGLDEFAFRMQLNPLDFEGGPYRWSMAIQTVVGGTRKELHYHSGIFCKPDGSLWYGSLRFRRDEQPAHLPAPCGLRPLSRMPDLSIQSTWPGGVKYIGELGGKNLREGFGLYQRKGLHHLGFWKGNKRHGWGVTRLAATFPMAPNMVTGDMPNKERELSWVVVGHWEDDRIVYGHRMINDDDIQQPVDISAVGGGHFPFYAGEFDAKNFPSGLGVAMTADWVGVGRFRGTSLAEGLVQVSPRQSSKTFVTRFKPRPHEMLPPVTSLVWDGWQASLTYLPPKPREQLQVGDVVLVPRMVVPQMVLDPPVGQTPGWLEAGALYAADSYWSIGGKAAETVRARAAETQKTPRYAEAARARQGQRQKAEADARQQAIRDHNARVAAERKRMDEEFRAEIAAANARSKAAARPSTPWYESGKGYFSSFQTENYETRRSAAIQRENDYKRQLIKDIYRR